MSRLAILVCIFSALLYILFKRTSIQLVFHPDRYHGQNINNGIFFEGWYYKIVLNEYLNTIIIIPGVHMNDDNRHSFIMIGYDNISHYYRFPFETFSSSNNEFLIKINNEKNLFSYEKLLINLQPKENDDATENFQMNLILSSHIFIPDLSWLAPGTMGPYSWIPTMQCYHHVLSMKHHIHGSIQIDKNEKINVSGIGYIEKDWGHSFPSMWIWGQANQWENTSSNTSTASLFFSLALIPWYFNLEFPGFLIVFEYNHEFYRFNTYLQSIIHDLSVDNNTNQISFNVYDLFFQYKLHISTYCNDTKNINGAMLYGPRYGRMDKYVKEILGKNIYFNVQLSKLIQNQTSIKDNKDLFLQHGYYEEIIFQGRAQNVALEITGNINWLSEQFRKTYENNYPWHFSFIRNFVQYYKLILASIIIIFFIIVKCR